MTLKQRTISLTDTQDKEIQRLANETTNGDFGKALRNFLTENGIK